MSALPISVEMLERIVPTRDLTNNLGAYYGAATIAPVEPIAALVTGLNPRAWPPCKHCGGNVNCSDYDPDTSAPLWGAK